MYNLKLKILFFIFTSIFITKFNFVLSNKDLINNKFFIDVKNKLDFQKIIDDTKKPAIINFYAPWNKDSMNFNKDFEALSKIYYKNVNFIKVDVTNNDLIQVVDTFGIYEIPTIFYKTIGSIKYNNLKENIELLFIKNNINSKISKGTIKIKNRKGSQR